MQLEGCIALVTGGSRGIGRTACLAFAREGAAVAVHYRERRDEAEAVADEIAAGGGRAAIVQADVTDPDEVERMMGEVAEFAGPGGLHVLFLNARHLSGGLARGGLGRGVGSCHRDQRPWPLSLREGGAAATEDGERLGGTCTGGHDRHGHAVPRRARLRPLLDGEGRDDGLHALARARARPGRRHGELRRAEPGRDRDGAMRPPAPGSRRSRSRRSNATSSRRIWSGRRVPRLGCERLRHRPDDRRRRGAGPELDEEARWSKKRDSARSRVGRYPESEGWFVLNTREALWWQSEKAGRYVRFEGKEAARFPEFGINIHVLAPGEPNCMYHGEDVQEDFLVLSGECLLLVEGEERRLRAWDFVHCPAWTEHVFIGAGDGPCAILMVGSRKRDDPVRYPVSELARRHGASVKKETTVTRGRPMRAGASSSPFRTARAICRARSPSAGVRREHG